MGCGPVFGQACPWDRGQWAHVQVLLPMKASVKLANILSEHRDLIKFPPHLADDLLHTAADLLNLMTSLAGHYNERGVMLWNITPKKHYLYHLVSRARVLNPGLSWTYSR